jgi:excisionase family DNA binding protein
MTILTIDEAARLLRVTKRTLYRLREIPRVRIGHRVMFLQEDLESWVKLRRDASIAPCPDHHAIDGWRTSIYHRNPIFRLKRNQSE